MKTEKQIENLSIALLKWGFEVKPRQVHPILGAWKCGTQACFGGHVATWPEFQAQGVYPCTSDFPAPCLLGYDVALPAAHVSRLLFGDPDLFRVAGLHPADTQDKVRRSAHEVVARRLEWALEHP